jgi:hypothetical protein
MSSHSPEAAPVRTVLRHVLGHLVVPVLLAAGMALAYLGAFHQPEPHQVRLDVVGSGPQVAVLASTLQDQLGDRAAVRTVATAAEARDALASRQVTAAYLPDPARPVLMLASAASDTSAVTAEKMLAPVALAQGLPLQVQDVAPPAGTDPTGQGIFFYLVALSVGAYSSAIAIGAAGARLPMRVRVLVGVGTAAVISAIATAVAGPLYGALPSHAAQIGLLAWLYTSAVVLVGVGLHPFLGRWTTGTMVGLFVMLNFTSSGGIFAPDEQPGFFAALHSFWIGRGLVEAGRDLEYFPGVGIGGHVAVLVGWLVAALVLTAVAAAVGHRRERAARPVPLAPAAAHPSPAHAAPSGPRPATRTEDRVVEEELEEAVPVG